MPIQTAPQIDIIRGKGSTINLDFTDSNDAVIDLTNKTLYFTVKEEIDGDLTDALAVISKEVTSHTNPTAGLTRISLTRDDTLNLTPGFYYYDFQLKGVGQDPISTIYGKLKVWADITRRI